MKYSIDQNALNKFIKNTEKKSDRALMYCWEYLAGKIQEQMKIDSYDLGTLERSITWQKVRTGLVEVGSGLDYAVIREYGRQPWRFPPLDALVGWTARKGMISADKSARYDDLYYMDKGVVFVIARSIARKGIKGKHTFQNVLNRERKEIQKIYIDYMQDND